MNQSQDSGSSQQRPFCRAAGCNFYGDPVTGFCSVCAKKNNVTNPAAAAAEPKADTLAPPKGTRRALCTHGHVLTSSCAHVASEPIAIRSAAATSANDGANLSTSPSISGSLGTSPDRPGSSRCAMCNKKLGLTGIKCRCDQYYCSNHRYSDQHNCTFDYKSKGRDELTKANPIIVSPKLDKI